MDWKTKVTLGSISEILPGIFFPIFFFKHNMNALSLTVFFFSLENHKGRIQIDCILSSHLEQILQ